MSKFELVNVLADALYPGSPAMTVELIVGDDETSILGLVEDPAESEGNLGLGLNLWTAPAASHGPVVGTVEREPGSLTVTPQLV